MPAYCCSAGELANSFAGALSSALASTDAVVFGHTNAKHSYCNPFVSVFDENHMGRYLVTPLGQMWKPWLAQLAKADGTHPERHPLWAQYPFMDYAQLAHALGLKKLEDIYARTFAM